MGNTEDVEGFPFTETEEIAHYFGDNEKFDLDNLDLNIENYRSFKQHLLFSDQSDTHASNVSDVNSAEIPITKKVAQKLEVVIFKKLQETQEERIILEVGN